MRRKKENGKEKGEKAAQNLRKQKAPPSLLEGGAAK